MSFCLVIILDRVCIAKAFLLHSVYAPYGSQRQLEGFYGICLHFKNAWILTIELEQLKIMAFSRGRFYLADPVVFFLPSSLS
jgi:hypothetical protein